MDTQNAKMGTLVHDFVRLYTKLRHHRLGNVLATKVVQYDVCSVLLRCVYDGILFIHHFVFPIFAKDWTPSKVHYNGTLP